MYHTRNGKLQVLLVHPGGPFWKNKDLGAWSIPKGEFGPDEDPLAAAKREFSEETGVAVEGEFQALGSIRQESGKVVTAWAVEGDLDVSLVKSNEFEIEWPPRSGKHITIPEVDRAEWFSAAQALEKINPAQGEFIRELARSLDLEPK